MPKRPPYTLLLITPHRLARADMGRGAPPFPLGLHQQPCPLIDDLPTLVETALRQGGPPGRRVWVLSSMVWTQTLQVSAGTTAGVKPAELQQALRYEAEALSGMNAMDTALGYLPVAAMDSGQSFWITQMLASVREQVAVIIRQAGGTLAGVCHPGGLPQPLADNLPADAPWQRIELWSDTIVGIHTHVPGATQHLILNTPPQRDRWQASIAPWRDRCGSVAHRELLLGAEPFYVPDMAPQFTLENEAHLLTWFTAWAHCLVSRQPAVPVVPPPTRQMARQRQVFMAAALGVITLGACVAHFTWLGRQRQERSAALQRLQEPAKALSASQKQATELEKDVTTLRERVQGLQRDVQRLADDLPRQRQRFGRLLELLATQQLDDLLVQAIDQQEGHVVVRGIALQPHLAAQFASALTPALQEYGWRVQPPTQQTATAAESGSPWTFTLLLTEFDSATAPPPSNVAANPAPARRRRR